MRLQNINIHYRKNHVIKDLDLDLKEGGINGLVGMNGAGKTTLLRGIFGVKPLKSGTMLWQDKPLTTRMIGFLETENFFYPKMRASEYLDVFRLSNPKFNPENWNALFELPLERLVDEYSTGMKKKLALMGVIGLDKPILMLDEPFNGVDLESNEKIKLVLKRLQEHGKTIIVTSHILETLTSICDQISILYKGQIDRTASPEAFDEIGDYLRKTISSGAQAKIDKIFNEQ